MNKHENVKTDTRQAMTRSTYTVDCFRRIKDAETGEVSIKRWVEERMVGANLMLALGGVFHNGARIA